MYNGVIVLNKPKGKTSHDMIYFMRRNAAQKRVGHTGTLDPEATGVLPICLGIATKAADYIACGEKKYRAHIHFGLTTDTEDLSGNVLTKCENISFDECGLKNAINDFVGTISQIPPMYSAVKINGQKLYELARKGKTIERKPREVQIHSIDLINFDKEEKFAVIDVVCSKGTYIRTLCNDIGSALGCGACMGQLVRLRSGVFNIENSYTTEQITQAASAGELDKMIIPTDELFADYEKIILDEKNEFKVRNGVSPAGFDFKDGKRFRLYAENGEFLCISQAENGKLKMLTSFWI